MKKQIKKWALRLAVTGLFTAGLLVIIVLNPILTYANKTAHDNFTIYYDQPLQPNFFERLDHANSLIKESEYYKPKLTFDICLNDGSIYPTLVKKIRGRAFAWGFHDKVVLQGIMNVNDNTVELNGYKWNLTQLLAHELTHCLQFDHFGLFKSNPIANIPVWKWEGYAEYIARRAGAQNELSENIAGLIDANKIDANSWEITIADGTIAPREYYNYWLLVKYCLEVKGMKYKELLGDATEEEVIRKEMMEWYGQRRLKKNN